MLVTVMAVLLTREVINHRGVARRVVAEDVVSVVAPIRVQAVESGAVDTEELGEIADVIAILVAPPSAAHGDAPACGGDRGIANNQPALWRWRRWRWRRWR